MLSPEPEPAEKKVVVFSGLPKYVLTIKFEENGTIESELHKVELAFSAMSKITARLGGKLTIDLFRKPYLTRKTLSDEERSTSVLFSRQHKHGSTHLCRLLKHLIELGVVTLNTEVCLWAASLLPDGDNARLVEYYRRLSFTGDYNPGSPMTAMKSTVAEILGTCRSGMDAGDSVIDVTVQVTNPPPPPPPPRVYSSRTPSPVSTP